jgi:small-conductance mechanosensitive channel
VKRWLAAFVFVWLALCARAWAQSESQAPDSPLWTPTAEAHAITLDGEELFVVRNALGPFTAAERAERAQRVLQRVADDPFFSADLIEVRSEENEGRLVYRGEVIGVVTALDALRERQTVEALLAQRLERVRAAVQAYRARRLPEANVQTGAFLALATLVLIAALVALARWRRRIRARADAPRAEGRLAALERRLGAGGAVVRVFERRGMGLVHVAITALLVLVYLEIVFALIPLTRAFALTVLRYVLAPLEVLWNGIFARIGDLFFIAVIAALAFYTLRLLRWLALEASRGALELPGIDADHALRLFKLVRIVVIAVALVMVFPYVPGSDSAAFRGLSLFFGALLTLGSSGTVGNLVGGVLLLFSRLFKVGDRIRVGEIEGDVLEVELLLTRVRTPKNELVSIPNGALLGGHVVNFSARAATDGLILHTSVTIGYDTPWRQVHELLLAAARNTDGLLADPPPFVLQTALSDFYVEYELNARTRTANSKAQIYSRLHENIQDEFNRAGVQIMSPHYEADPPHPKLAPMK